MTDEKTKVPFYKRKTLVIPVVALFALSLIAAAVLYHQTTVSFTVAEGLTANVTAVSIGGYPGETQSIAIEITNAGSVPVHTNLVWAEDANSGVNYTTQMPTGVLINPGSNIVIANFTTDTDSATGNYNGTISYNRY
jgi:hypothetical protein